VREAVNVGRKAEGATRSSVIRPLTCKFDSCELVVLQEDTTGFLTGQRAFAKNELDFTIAPDTENVGVGPKRNSDTGSCELEKTSDLSLVSSISANFQVPTP